MERSLAKRYRQVARAAQIVVDTFPISTIQADEQLQLVNLAVGQAWGLFRNLHVGHNVQDVEISREERVGYTTSMEFDRISRHLFCVECNVASVVWPKIVIGATY